MVAVDSWSAIWRGDGKRVEETGEAQPPNELMWEAVKESTGREVVGVAACAAHRTWILDSFLLMDDPSRWRAPPMLKLPAKGLARGLRRAPHPAKFELSAANQRQNYHQLRGAAMCRVFDEIDERIACASWCWDWA